MIEFLLSMRWSVGYIIFFIVLYFLIGKLLDRQAKGHTDRSIIKTIVLFFVILIGVFTIILALPISETQKTDITNVLGIVLSAVLGLSSTTFIGNALAGISLKLRNSFKPGDFITVDNIFGRVTEQGLFHTEIQTIDRDLTSLPNMTLATNSVKVTRSSGTFISAEVSLGYDVNRLKIEEALLCAANKLELRDPFVHIISLGDFSIVYRIHGLLENVKSILTARSRLAAAVIDELHAANIEIVSPTFMNQRQVGTEVFIPKKFKVKTPEVQSDSPENSIFDKAEEAESIENRKKRLAELDEMIKEDTLKLKEEIGEETKQKLEHKVKRAKELKEKINQKIDEQLKDLENND